MNLTRLPVSPEHFLKHLRFATEIDTVEKNQMGAREDVFYSHIRENTFELYERRAFIREKTFTFGGIYLRGAVAEDAGGCQVATELARSSDNTKTALIVGLLFLVSLIGTILSGNLFATMLPILVAISGGFLVADGIGAMIQIRRLKKKWRQILDAMTEREGAK